MVPLCILLATVYSWKTTACPLLLSLDKSSPYDERRTMLRYYYLWSSSSQG